MKNSKVIELVKEKNLTIPMYIFKLRSNFDIELFEFIFLMYLYNLGDKIIFDVNTIANGFGINLGEAMNYISKLQDKKLLALVVIKNEKNITEEYISLDLFYEKLSKFLVEEFNTTSEVDAKTIFEIIEREFGRTLTPIEYEIIKAWLDSNYSEELIKEAVKEASFNGVANLRYIDKILYEWSKKGFKNKEDIDKNRVSFKETKEKPQLFDYDWMEE